MYHAVLKPCFRTTVPFWAHIKSLGISVRCVFLYNAVVKDCLNPFRTAVPFWAHIQSHRTRVRHRFLHNSALLKGYLTGLGLQSRFGHLLNISELG